MKVGIHYYGLFIQALLYLGLGIIHDNLQKSTDPTRMVWVGSGFCKKNLGRFGFFLVEKAGQVDALVHGKYWHPPNPHQNNEKKN